MSKRNAVSYIKPEEPSFLRKLKEQIGYKEGPSVDTKREDLGPVRDEDLEDTVEEQPIVVVLQPGDLTAQEAALEKERLERELEETPADLSVPVVFRPPSKTNKSKESSETGSSSSKRPLEREEGKKKAKKLKNKALLSFNEEENDDC